MGTDKTKIVVYPDLITRYGEDGAKETIAEGCELELVVTKDEQAEIAGQLDYGCIAEGVGDISLLLEAIENNPRTAKELERYVDDCIDRMRDDEDYERTVDYHWTHR